MSGHNPNKNYQSDELQNVAALLRSLPQVTAPMNFDALLKARIAQAKIAQKADVTALLQELPRIAAPSDFDFKLRARIAQAKSKEEKTSSLGWFSEVFGRTFSWAQAGAGMAAVVLFIGVITFQLMKPAATPTASQPIVARAGSLSANTPTFADANKTAKTFGNVETGSPGVAATMQSRAARLNPTPVKFMSAAPKSNQLKPRADNTIVNDIKPPAAPEVRDDLIAANTVLIKHSSGETRVVKVAEVSFGLQSASLRSNSPRAAQANLEVASAQIIY